MSWNAIRLGLRYENGERISFSDSNKQTQFSELQIAYNKEFNERLKSLENMEMPEYLSNDKYMSTFMKNTMFEGYKRSIVTKEMGSSPYEMVKQYFKSNGKETKTETKTEVIPEFRQAETK